MKPFWPALPRMIRTRNTGRRRTDRRTKQMRVVNKFRLSTLCGQSDRGEIRHALIGGLSNCGERFMPESRLQSGVSAVLRKIRNPAAERFCGGVLCVLRIVDFCAVVIGNRCSCGFGDCVSNRMLSMLHATNQAETQGVIPRKGFLAESKNNAWVSMQ